MTTEASHARSVPPAAAGGTPASPTARQVWRAGRGPLVIGLVLVLVAVISVLLGRETRAGYLDPGAPSPNGGRALASILRDQGTTVRVARSVEAARSAAGPETLVLVTRPWIYSNGQIDALRRLPGDRVLVAPTAGMVRRLAPGVRQEGTVSVSPREPACDLGAARLAGTAEMGGVVYSAAATSGDVPALCYPSGGRASLVRVGADRRSVTVLGTGDPLTNDRLDEQGNAALALNLLGSGKTVIWLWPATPTLPGERERSPWDLISGEAKLAAVQLVVAVIVVALWRARRLGPVVAEPLPVVVRSAETVEGRGRLYRARRARDSAAEALRAACRERIVPRLGLSRGADEGAVVAAVAARSSRPPAVVHDLLYGSAPRDDATLVRLAGDLDALEREVGRS